ncbi:MAG: PrgI family protein [Candidatus Gottesmanbacteria bacterium]
MEQHPVPQNVTTFQFRLIGDMTIKQFGYLAAGAILAYLSYILPLPFFFTWPLTVLFGLMGIGFAFVPIEERPMDVWVLSFLKSVYAPTQFVWHRTQPRAEPQINPVTATTQTQRTALSSAPPPPTQTAGTPIATTLQGFYTQTPTEPKKSFFDSLFSWVDDIFPKPKLSVAASTTQAPHVQLIQPVVSVVPQEKNPELDALQNKIASLQTELGDKAQAETRVLELQKEMTEMMKQKRETEEQLLTMKKQSITPQAPKKPAQSAGIITTPKSQGPTVKIIMPDAAARAGLPRLTTFTNVVTGIIKDNQGGLLPGVLVTVRDKDGVPLRALKTNKIGQFAASTQLLNGVYFIEVEDPRGRYTFDRAQVTLNGTIVPAIEIGAKSKRDIDRENLSKQIFGQTTNT